MKSHLLIGLSVLLMGTLPSFAAETPASGSSVRTWAALQAARAKADEFVVYRGEWQLRGTIPTASGKAHLERIAKRLQGTPYCVVVQPESNGDLNEVRRRQVVNYLSDHGVVDAAHRVVLAHPEAEGLHGNEAEQMGQLQLTGGH